MKKNKHSLKISRSFFGDTTLDGYPIDTYSNDELKILKNLLTQVLGELKKNIYIFRKVKRMAARYNFRKTILHRLEICWNVLTHKTFIAYTTDDIGDKWSLINNIESLEQFGQWLVSGGYKENSNYKK